MYCTCFICACAYITTSLYLLLLGNKSSPSRTSGSALVGGAKAQTTPMKARISTAEMTRGGIPSPPRHNAHLMGDVPMRGKQRTARMRPASWDVSLIYSSEGGEGERRKMSQVPSEQGKFVGEDKQFHRKENGRLPVRKKASPPEDGSRDEMARTEESEGVCVCVRVCVFEWVCACVFEWVCACVCVCVCGMTFEPFLHVEPIIYSATGEHLSQEVIQM